MSQVGIRELFYVKLIFHVLKIIKPTDKLKTDAELEKERLEKLEENEVSLIENFIEIYYHFLFQRAYLMQEIERLDRDSMYFGHTPNLSI